MSMCPKLKQRGSEILTLATNLIYLNLLFVLIMSLQFVVCWLPKGDINAHFSILGPHTVGGGSLLLQDL